MNFFRRARIVDNNDSLVIRMAGVFLLLNLIYGHTGTDNADSRYAMTMGMVLNQTFAIDGFEKMTGDWSQTPDGKYYSNKPPGPAILAYPATWIFDKVTIDQNWDEETKYKTRVDLSASILRINSWLFQLIPCLLMAIYFDRFMRRKNISWEGRSFSLIAYFFGTTAAMLQNSYFGHGLAAWALFSSVLWALDKKIIWSASAFGLALLTDYGSAFALPGLFALWFNHSEDKIANLKHVVYGAAIPAIVWIWYHTTCFGSPFYTSHKFLNPIWTDVPDSENALWGIFRSYPKPDIAFKLLFGQQRGLLFTQPWILVCLVLGVIHLKKILKTSPWSKNFLFMIYSFFIVIWLVNAAFNGWHGGDTIGPRYISIALYLFPILSGILWEHLSQGQRAAMIVTLGLTTFYFGMAFCQSILVTHFPWEQLPADFLRRSLWMKIKVSIGMIIVLKASYWCMFQSKYLEHTANS